MKRYQAAPLPLSEETAATRFVLLLAKLSGRRRLCARHELFSDEADGHVSLAHAPPPHPAQAPGCGRNGRTERYVAVSCVALVCRGV